MKFVLFYHSLVSDWNHRSAHFLRGVAADLLDRGHQVTVFEPLDSWSRENLVRDHGEQAIADFHRTFPMLHSRRYHLDTLDLDEVLDGADVVLVHERNDRELVRRIGEHRNRRRAYRLFFHDTHHRAATMPEEMEAYDLSHYDGVLAYGKVIRDLYIDRGWAARAWTWHEAADTRVFVPHPRHVMEGDAVWIGNWRSEERAAELDEFFFRPAEELGLRAEIYGAGYPDEALRIIRERGISYGGRIANSRVPEVFSRYRFTVHVPRRPYAMMLRGIPTIRPFEAMACGIPMISTPWLDMEGLFTPGDDFLVARNGEEMVRYMRALVEDYKLGEWIASNGLRAIRERHTCTHRVSELFAILQDFDHTRKAEEAVETRRPASSTRSSSRSDSRVEVEA